MKSLTARSSKDTPVIIETPTTRSITHTTLGAVSPLCVVNLEVRVSIVPKKIKVNGNKKKDLKRILRELQHVITCVSFTK
jgi:hypothetical protein